MRMPFERLMELVAGLSDEDAKLPMGDLSERWGEPVQRIMDAIDACRVLAGERTYIGAYRGEADPLFQWTAETYGPVIPGDPEHGGADEPGTPDATRP